MKQVKLTEAVGVRQPGEVLNVDDASAANLVENRKVAEYFDPDKHEPGVERTAPPRGSVGVTQVVDADEPAPAAVATVESASDSGDHTEHVHVAAPADLEPAEGKSPAGRKAPAKSTAATS